MDLPLLGFRRVDRIAVQFPPPLFHLVERTPRFDWRSAHHAEYSPAGRKFLEARIVGIMNKAGSPQEESSLGLPGEAS